MRLLAAIDRLLAQGVLSEAQADALIELIDMMDQLTLDKVKQQLTLILGNSDETRA